MKQEQLTTLAVRMKQGDHKAAEQMYAALNAKVYGFFFSRTGSKKDVAEDLTQDIFMRLVQKVQSYDEGKGAFVVWFWRIARNMLVDHYRAKKETSFSSYEESSLETLAIAPAYDFDARLKRSALDKIVMAMTEEDRKLFSLRYLNDLPYKDISEILEKPEGALRVSAWRMKEKILQNEQWGAGI